MFFWQVFAGSLYGEDEDDKDLSSIRSFLGLSLPISQSNGWKQLFDSSYIARDFFVKPQHRKRVAREDGALKLMDSPFTESPVMQVRGLYEARHLSAALPHSPLARLLGVFAGNWFDFEKVGLAVLMFKRDLRKMKPKSKLKPKSFNLFSLRTQDLLIACHYETAAPNSIMG